MLSLFLAGIQYALGDLKVDDTPRPRPAVDIDGVLRELSNWDRGRIRVLYAGSNGRWRCPEDLSPPSLRFSETECFSSGEGRGLPALGRDWKHRRCSCPRATPG